MNKNDCIYIAGHRGMVGSSILRLLKRKGFTNLIYRNSSSLDLTNQQAVVDFFKRERPKYVFVAAARVGGIMANFENMADFTYQNLMIQNNLIHNAYRFGVKKLLFLGSSCIYPKEAPQPLKEEYLLTGHLEPTNEGYALAKISGIKMCAYYRRQYGADFVSLMPTNLYGKNDNYDLNTSHVVAALIRKIHQAKLAQSSSVTIWGTGTPKREFLYVDDLAEACYFAMQHYSAEGFLNVGTGTDITILALAEMISEVVGFKGNILTDTTKPDGTMRKVMDVAKMNQLGWKAKVSLREGLERTYEYYKEDFHKLRS